MKKRNLVKLIICAVILLALILGSFIYLGSHSKITIHKVPATAVLVQKPKAMTIGHEVTAIASVVAKQTTYITPQNAGYIAKILFKEGQYVKKGQLLIQLNSTKLRAQLAADETALRVARTQYTNDKGLFKKGLISADLMGTDTATYANDQSTVIADKRDLANNNLIAPFSGYLGAKTISVGDHVTASQELVLLVDSNHLLAEYNLPEDYAPLIKLGQAVAITSKLIPGKVFHGKVEYIAPQINTTSRTIAVHAIINNPEHKLLPGEFVTVKQTLSKAAKGWFIPEQAVTENLSGDTVFIVKNGKAIRTTVMLGERKHGYVQVLKGLKPNDKVITAGQNEVNDNQAVTIKK